MKRIATLFIVATLLVLIGCNMMGRKDEVLARVGDQDLMRSELDFALSSVPADRRASPESRKMVFNSLLESRIMGEAAKKLVPQAEEYVEVKLSELKKRDLANVYQRIYVYENLAHSEDQLFAWFRKHEKEFAKDSVQVDFKAVRDSVVMRITLEEKSAEVRKYFEENKAMFAEKGAADIGCLQSTDSLKLVQAIAQIAGGTAFDAVASTILTDSSLLARKGHVGLIKDGVIPPELRGVAGSVYQLFDKARRPQANEFLPIVLASAEPKLYAALVVFRYQDSPTPTFEKSKSVAEKFYLQKYRQEISKKMSDSLKSKYKVEMSKIPAPDAKVFYTKNKDQFKTLSSFRVLHIAGSDSAKLATLAQGLKSESDFLAKGGRSIIAKLSHCLPDSIGMLPELFTVLDGRKPGFKTAVLKAPDTQKFEVFWLLESIAPQVKPFERARKDAEARLMEGGEGSLDSSFALVSVNGAPVIWEKDVMKLRTEVPPQQRRQYNHQH